MTYNYIIDIRSYGSIGSNIYDYVFCETFYEVVYVKDVIHFKIFFCLLYINVHVLTNYIMLSKILYDLQWNFTVVLCSNMFIIALDLVDIPKVQSNCYNI